MTTSKFRCNKAIKRCWLCPCRSSQWWCRRASLWAAAGSGSRGTRIGGCTSRPTTGMEAQRQKVRYSMYNFLFLIAETKEKRNQANSVSYRPINHDVKTKEGKNLKSSFVVINQYQPYAECAQNMKRNAHLLYINEGIVNLPLHKWNPFRKTSKNVHRDLQNWLMSLELFHLLRKLGRRKN